MNTLEFQNELEALTGKRVEQQVLLRYERDGLFPHALRGSGGRGLGRWVEYSPQMLFQAAAAVRMVHGSWIENREESILDRGEEVKVRYRFDKSVVKIARQQILYEFTATTQEELQNMRFEFQCRFSRGLGPFLEAAIDIYKILVTDAKFDYCARHNIPRDTINTY